MATKHSLYKVFCGADNNTLDIARILWFQTTQAYIGLTFYAIYKGSFVFDPLIWGSGLAALAGGFGAALYAKAGTEPSASMSVKTDKVSFAQSFGKASAADVSGDDTDTVDATVTSTTTVSPKD